MLEDEFYFSLRWTTLYIDHVSNDSVNFGRSRFKWKIGWPLPRRGYVPLTISESFGLIAQDKGTLTNDNPLAALRSSHWTRACNGIILFTHFYTRVCSPYLFMFQYNMPFGLMLSMGGMQLAKNIDRSLCLDAAKPNFRVFKRIQRLKSLYIYFFLFLFSFFFKRIVKLLSNKYIANQML